MSSHISYKGQYLGNVCLDDTNTGKFVFVANSLDSLATLFRISPDEQIEIEGGGLIPYKKFQENCLNTISGFYPTQDAWLLKNHRARTIDEFDNVYHL